MKLSIYFKQIYFKEIQIAAKIKQGFTFLLLEIFKENCQLDFSMFGNSN